MGGWVILAFIVEHGVRPPGTRIFVSKKIYSRKIKHKKDEERE
jgi:hypothetical protein